MIRITPINRPTHMPPVVGKEPAVSGVYFLAARLPAIASIGTIMKKRPTHMQTPSVPL